MTHWHDAGFGTDPEGDAERRAELESRRVDPSDARVIARLTGPPDPEVDALVARLVGSDEPAPAEVELYVDGHALTRTEYGTTVAIVCACGRWECIVTGPSSAAWAGRDYRRHVDDEERGSRDA